VQTEKSNHMQILVLGASGRTGKIFTQLATSKNHQVTAIIRNKKDAILPKVNYIEGLPTDEQLLTKALQGIDAVVVSLNINRTSDNPFGKVVSPFTLISDSVKALISAMVKNNVKRIITVSASGVGDSWNDMYLIARLLIRYSNIWKAYEDHEKQEQIVRQSQMDWTIVRPVMLNDKDSDEYNATIGKPTSGSISRKGVAKFILDALESEKYFRDTVTLSK
jgi:putative NADH-flavin reductase